MLPSTLHICATWLSLPEAVNMYWTKWQCVWGHGVNSSDQIEGREGRHYCRKIWCRREVLWRTVVSFHMSEFYHWQWGWLHKFHCLFFFSPLKCKESRLVASKGHAQIVHPTHHGFHTFFTLHIFFLLLGISFPFSVCPSCTAQIRSHLL